MATVRVLTAARMLAIEAMSVVSGVISGDNLILTRYDGTTVNAGNVRGPKGDKGDTGSISVSPAGGDLSGSYPNPTIGASKVTETKLADGAVTAAKVAAAHKDGAAGTVGMRSLGGGAQQAAAGNHTHAALVDSAWTDFSATAGDSPFAGSGVARAQHRRVGPDVHIRVRKTATAALNLSANTTGNFAPNIKVLGGVPTALCPVTDPVQGEARFDDTLVTAVLDTSGNISILGGFPRAWASGDLFAADFKFFTDAV